MSNFTEEVGVIIAGTSTSEIIFVSSKESYPSLHDYVCFSLRELDEDGEKEVEVLSKVSSIEVLSEVIDSNINPANVKRILAYNLDEARVIGRARIIGYFLNNKKEPQIPRRTAPPGTILRKASSSFLQKFLSYEEGEGLYIGNLAVRPEVKVRISLNGLRRHLAIIAQTGAGKTYLSGVLMEELLKYGATLLVIDPHADYVFLGLKPDGSPSDFNEKILLFKNPLSVSRYGEKEIGLKFRDLMINLLDLNMDEIFELLRVSRQYVNIRNIIKNAIEEIKKESRGMTLENLKEKLMEICSENEKSNDCKAATQAIKRIQELETYKIFGESSFQFEDLLVQGKASILDLSGMDIESQDFVVYLILKRLLHKAQIGDLEFPVFLFIEEAHNFVPSDETSFSSRIINKIAAEGRKFGIFLTLITQRPSRISSNALSQCNSQIIMRITNPRDQEAIVNSSERLGEEELQDLPGLNTGEAIVVGEVTKVPVMIRVRKRETKEGGADIDIVSKLRALKNEEEIKKERIETHLNSGIFSED
ncbi:MAG: ATP-binding protein [Candidatus Brockarchaeota archaeon]|nr:ATP-binding protein [Candidatus Brockarchaeota archaeon]MBO3767828.1 ATP-binding protein [Candidatus Brockarchaeota archaeon]